VQPDPVRRYAASVDPLTGMLLVALSLFAGIVVAWAVFALLGVTVRRGRRSITRARGADRPDWAPGIWICTSCLSSNTPSATRCERCRRPREELVERVEPVRPDSIPERIEVPPGAFVSLRHDPEAHTDPGAAHWRLLVGGQTVASAARRDGASAMLRALRGADRVDLDVNGTGARTYRLADVIARFEGARFPLEVPCPERT